MVSIVDTMVSRSTGVAVPYWLLAETAAFTVVQARIVRWLPAPVLAGAAAQYLLLAAEFVAVTQVLVYIGAIVVLFLFGIMLTRAPIGRHADVDNDQRWLAAIVSLLLVGVLGTILVKAFPFDDTAKIDFDRISNAGQTTSSIGQTIFQSYVIPFEVISILLLAATIGAIVVARRD